MKTIKKRQVRPSLKTVKFQLCCCCNYISESFRVLNYWYETKLKQYLTSGKNNTGIKRSSTLIPKKSLYSLCPVLSVCTPKLIYCSLCRGYSLGSKNYSEFNFNNCSLDWKIGFPTQVYFSSKTPFIRGKYFVIK